jgi:phosphatidylglycerophosphatase A
MKQEIDRRPPKGIADYLSLAISTCGVGYLPLAPGTWGSAVGVAMYMVVAFFLSAGRPLYLIGGVLGLNWSNMIIAIPASVTALIVVLFVGLCLAGVWAAGRSTALLGNSDPSQAVVDEVIGQLTVFFFVPFGIGWPFILAGFLLFRLFDIWKPYPIDLLQALPGGLGVCADDFLAGIYAGACLAVIYAVALMF